MKTFDQNLPKRISFILATKNRAMFLEKALASHRKLISPIDELIIIDGASKDKTATVIAKNSDIVDIFVSENDTSEGDATNKGVLLARGKYIKLLTDDDIFHKKAIEKAYKIIEKNHQIDILLCGGVKKRGEETAFVWVPEGVRYGEDVADVFKYGGCGLGLLIRRGVFSKIGLFNPQAVAMDVDFLVKAISLGAKVKFCRLNMYLHKVEKHSAVNRHNERLMRDFERIKKQYKVKSDLMLDVRVGFSQLVFPKLPKSFQGLYLRTFKKRPKSVRLIKPVWDGGLS